MNKKNKSEKLLLIVGGSTEASATNINKLIYIMNYIGIDIYLVTYCKENSISSLTRDSITTLNTYKNNLVFFTIGQFDIIKIFITQKNFKDFKYLFFGFGQDLQLLPIIFAKLMKKKIIIRSDGRSSIIGYYKNKFIIWNVIYKVIEEINYRLADIILTECDYMIKENDFLRYNKSYVGNLYVNTEKFKITQPFQLRKYNFGYIGRLEKIKGVQVFLRCIPIILEKYPTMKVLIAGSGELEEEVKNYINDMKLSANIDFINWISHDDLPKFLNSLKLIILPSYKEGLPNIILEAMACGTPVLSTPVGGIPGLIKDSETGFIIEHNSPDCIENNFERIQNFANIETIIINARQVIENEFSDKVTINRYKKLFELIR